MLHDKLFIFDIETIPDTEAVKNLTDFSSTNVDELREELERYHLDVTAGKNGFPRQMFHKIVAISYVVCDIKRDSSGESYILRDVRSGGSVDSSEKELVESFFKFMNAAKPRLVSYNGRGFDIPVLKYRAMKYGVPATALYKLGDKWNSYNSRYSADWHCDLLDTLSDYGASTRGKLNEVCSILGFPGKFGVDGSKVTVMYDNDEIKEIRDYCETDVVNTYLVYIRQQLMNGNMTKENYNSAILDMKHFLENADKDEQAHMHEFLEAWTDANDGNFELD
jgi:predicted PolB exonuclease-like 3'-5' exonuclease